MTEAHHEPASPAERLGSLEWSEHPSDPLVDRAPGHAPPWYGPCCVGNSNATPAGALMS